MPDTQANAATKRFYVTELRPIWVKEFYAVDAISEEAASDAYLDGDYEYLGHELGDAVSFLDSETEEVQQLNAPPFVAHPA